MGDGVRQEGRTCAIRIELARKGLVFNSATAILSPPSRAPAYSHSSRRDLQGREAFSLELRVRSGECRAASDISAPGDPCRPRSDHPGVVSRFNSRSNARCTGGWWVHGSKDGPPSFRLLNGFDYRFGRCEVVAKTWHYHGAAKAASEIKTQEREAPPSRPLFVSAPALHRRAGRSSCARGSA